MQFKFGIVLLILITTTSCVKKTVLETTFDCSNSVSFSDTKKVKDIKKNFTIAVPENWKTQLYYDEFQSDIFTADTTKELSDTYILDASWKFGELILDTGFETKMRSNSDMNVVISKFENIQEKPAFWYVEKGENKGFDYQVLHIYLKTSVDTYLEIKTEVYGSKNVEKRFCESMQIIKSIEFI
ncbi:MAG: hypothetical protein COA67_04240 [Lutibacter sp.]|nr:MAG: hypothetical protein COA67_04240 [Lutibacter sp.]